MKASSLARVGSESQFSGIDPWVFHLPGALPGRPERGMSRMNLEGFPLTLSRGAELARCRNAGRGFEGLCGQAGASWVPGVLVLQVTGAQADAGMGGYGPIYGPVAGAEATGLTSAHQSTWCLGTGLLSPARSAPALPPHRPLPPLLQGGTSRIRPERTFGPCYGCCYSAQPCPDPL